MSDFFGLDFSALTDEQLISKLDDLNVKLSWAGGNSSSSLMGNLVMMLENVETELRMRNDYRVTKAMAIALADPIETDPELAALTKPVKPVEADKKAPRLVTQTRSKKPANANALNKD